jgi:hypothetical protein
VTSEGEQEQCCQGQLGAAYYHTKRTPRTCECVCQAVSLRHHFAGSTSDAHARRHLSTVHWRSRHTTRTARSAETMTPTPHRVCVSTPHSRVTSVRHNACCTTHVAVSLVVMMTVLLLRVPPVSTQKASWTRLHKMVAVDAEDVSRYQAHPQT